MSGPASEDQPSGDQPSTGQPSVDLLAHDAVDHVAVAVRDVPPGDVRVAYLDSERSQSLQAAEQIPFGHKMALADLEQGAEVIEYGVRVGVTTCPVRRGELVHTHNIRSARWQTN